MVRQSPGPIGPVGLTPLEAFGDGSSSFYGVSQMEVAFLGGNTNFMDVSGEQLVIPPSGDFLLSF